MEFRLTCQQLNESLPSLAPLQLAKSCLAATAHVAFLVCSDRGDLSLQQLDQLQHIVSVALLSLTYGEDRDSHGVEHHLVLFRGQLDLVLRIVVHHHHLQENRLDPGYCLNFKVAL